MLGKWAHFDMTDLFQEIFLKALKGRLADLLDLETEATSSLMMDENPVQDSFRYRAKYLGLRIAALLIDEKGDLNQKMLQEVTQILAQGSCVLGPNRVGDVLIFNHIKQCLGQLESPEIWNAIKKFSPPLCHRGAEEMIRETLWPEPIRTLQTPHVRKAVLASWLTLLRQSTGSCFATAPAILIQKSAPLQFFKDLYDLLSLGQLKRTFGGKEYSVPLSLSSSAGDLQKVVAHPFFGLAVALHAVSVNLSLEKIKGAQTVENQIKNILLEDAELTEEDLRDEEHLARIQMTPLLAKQGAVYYQRPSKRAQKVAEWKKRFDKARMTFKTITECALLRCWEYTLASLSDVKTEFARWNLYIGLGLHPDEKNGIGAFLYEQINRRLHQCNAEIERLTQEYEIEINALQTIEVMIRSAVSEIRLAQLKADWMSHSASANTISEMRSRLIDKANGLVGFFAWLIGKYDEKLQEQFQEVFDPDLSREQTHTYEDSPAGFRLVYKHGRSDALQWTLIHRKEEFIEALREFFSWVENELEPPPAIGKELIDELTTLLIQFIRGEEFLEWAMARSKEKGRLSPWHYISGGTLQTLLMAYRNRDRPFKEISIVPHSAEELLRFLAKIDREGPILMHSPTHAFIFYPKWLNHSANLKSMPSQKWTIAMQEHLTHKLSDRLPAEERALFLHLMRQKTTSDSNLQFRMNLIEALGPRIQQPLTLVDSFLYENIYLQTPSQAQESLSKILNRRGMQLEGTFFGPLDLYELAKMTILQSTGCAISSVDWDKKIAEEMRNWELLPNALPFGDTNWSGWIFGFIQNPATGQLELWRLNRSATRGFPMTDWKEWLCKENNSPWILLSAPEEYILR